MSNHHIGDITYSVACRVNPERYTGRVYCDGKLVAETATVAHAIEAWALLGNPEPEETAEESCF